MNVPGWITRTVVYSSRQQVGNAGNIKPREMTESFDIHSTPYIYISLLNVNCATMPSGTLCILHM